MSLLADLLSKKNDAGPSGNKGIPPTLVMAHSDSAKVGGSKRRYAVIALFSVVTIAVGVFAVLQFERLTSLADKKPTPLTMPVEKPKVEAGATQQPQAVPPPAVLPTTEQVKVASVGPVLKPTSSSRQDTATRHAVVKPQKRHPVRTASFVRKQTAGEFEQKQHVPSPATIESVSSPKIDTAVRDSLLYAARSAEMVGDWRSAMASYRKALKIDPDNFKIMSNLAAVLNNLGLFDEGAMEAKRALSKRPDYVPALINAAIAYSSTGNSLEALLLFSKASSADPTNRNLTINLGILQERAGKLEEAKMTYRQLADAGDPLALLGMGRIHEQKGNRLEAVRAYRQILALPSASPALKKEAKGRILRMEE